jgi:hypothetical protein
MPNNWFGRKEPLPKELEGLTPEQVVEKLKETETLRTQLTEQQGKVTELTSKFETFSSEIEAKVTSGVEAAVAKLRPGGDGGGGGGNNNDNKTAADFLTEPGKAFAEHAAPLAALALGTAAIVAKNAARDKLRRMQQANPGKNFDGYFFEKFENEIDELAKTISAAQLANPGTWEYVYYNIKGRHADETAAQFKDGTMDSVIESASAGARSRGSEDNKPKLTDLELKIATKLGQTPEQYLAQKTKIGDTGMGVNI